jgi:hypothetical protein
LTWISCLARDPIYGAATGPCGCIVKFAMRIVLLAVLAAGLGVGAVPPVMAQHYAHHPAANATADAPVQRFATDTLLRENMRGIRKSVDAFAHYEHGHIGPQQVAILAGNIVNHLNDVIANCKLPPDADAALHAVIVPLMRSAATLKAEPARSGAIAEMRGALGEYRRRFHDPELDLED